MSLGLVTGANSHETYQVLTGNSDFVLRLPSCITSYSEPNTTRYFTDLRFESGTVQQRSGCASCLCGVAKINKTKGADTVSVRQTSSLHPSHRTSPNGRALVLCTCRSQCLGFSRKGRRGANRHRLGLVV